MIRLAARRLLCGMFLLTASAVPAAQPANTLSPEEIADGWILLYDGETSFGWTAHSKADWKFSDGVISVASGEPGLLCTNSPFADFVLKVDFRSAPKTNSGIFLRTVPGPTDPAKDCYELNIADAGTSPFPTGSFVGRKKAAGDHDTTDWQSYEVTAEGGRFVIKLDGKVVLQYTDPAPIGRGLIGLQRNTGPVQYRNVKLKPLGLKSLFNGKDLSGWKPFDADAGRNKSRWTVTPEGEMHVSNGPGALESQGQYADFVLQLAVKTRGKNLNSGVFFRCIPGQYTNGYESQIHNGFKDGDRSKPADFGTGGIYRRVPARRVVADDLQWFHKTLIAAGPHIAVWVNGYQVTDWTDTRAPHENPRAGLRLEAGTLMLQGHDPTTDILFKDLRLAELAPAE